MATTQINIRIDEELKMKMETLCDELGMNLTTAITLFVKKMVRDQRLPFDLALESKDSSRNEPDLN